MFFFSFSVGDSFFFYYLEYEEWDLIEIYGQQLASKQAINIHTEIRQNAQDEYKQINKFEFYICIEIMEPQG